MLSRKIKELKMANWGFCADCNGVHLKHDSTYYVPDYQVGCSRHDGTWTQKSVEDYSPAELRKLADRLEKQQAEALAKPKTTKILDSVHFKHDSTYYVPCYQINTTPCPTFKYSMADATTDEQLCMSFKPDYVLVLKGEVYAVTKPVEVCISGCHERCPHRPEGM
jgi:hypothetical protein